MINDDHPHEVCHNPLHQHQPEPKSEPEVHQDSLNVWTQYKPLIVILSFCMLMPWAQSNSVRSQEFMYLFMGYFFVFLSLFKLFDLKGFVDGFETYDLVSMRFRGYAYCYPFIELCLGLAYLAHFELVFTNFVTFAVMFVSGVGVLKSILSGKKIKCACLGTVLNVPLSTVSVLENFGMGAMAAYQILQGSW